MSAVRDTVNPGGSPRRGAGRQLSDLAAVYGLAVVFVLVMVLFGLLRPNTFFSAINVNTVLVGQSVTAMLALGEMVPLATKQFDLSVGFHLGMAQILIIGLQVNSSLSWPLASAIVLVIAVLVGALNGVLVTRLGIDPFIATMGVGTLLYGVSNWYSGGQQIVAPNLPDSFTNLTEIIWHVPLPALYVLIASVVLWLVTERLPVGRSFYVIGAKPPRSRTDRHPHQTHDHRRLCRIGTPERASPASCSAASWKPARRRPARIFAAGLCGDAAGRDFDPSGRVNVVGTLLAVLILAFSFSGVQQLGAAFYMQYFFNGGILIVAVGLSVYAAARRRGRRRRTPSACPDIARGQCRSAWARYAPIARGKPLRAACPHPADRG